MFRYIVRRLLQMILAFFGTTLIVFALMFLGRGDALHIARSLAGEKPVSEAQLNALIAQFHLDQSFIQQYLWYIKGLLHLDWGLALNGREIKDILAQALPVTATLALVAFTIIFGVTAGIVAGIRRGSIFDNSTLVLTLVVIGIPTIVLAPLAQYLFAVKWPIFPATAGADPNLYQLLLPGLVLGSLSLATALRLTRASV